MDLLQAPYGSPTGGLLEAHCRIPIPSGTYTVLMQYAPFLAGAGGALMKVKAHITFAIDYLTETHLSWHAACDAWIEGATNTGFFTSSRP